LQRAQQQQVLLQQQAQLARKEFLDAVTRTYTLPYVILFESWGVQEFYDATDKAKKPSHGFFATEEVKIDLDLDDLNFDD
jgi:hypothetical protein